MIFYLAMHAMTSACLIVSDKQKTPPRSHNRLCLLPWVNCPRARRPPLARIARNYRMVPILFSSTFLSFSSSFFLPFLPLSSSFFLSFLLLFSLSLSFFVLQHSLVLFSLSISISIPILSAYYFLSLKFLYDLRY